LALPVFWYVFPMFRTSFKVSGLSIWGVLLDRRNDRFLNSVFYMLISSFLAPFVKQPVLWPKCIFGIYIVSQMSELCDIISDLLVHSTGLHICFCAVLWCFSYCSTIDWKSAGCQQCSFCSGLLLIFEAFCTFIWILGLVL
jgi:hypothetical protein